MGSNSKILPLDSHPRVRERAAASGALDLLANVFDEIAADTALPTAIRAEVARLRLPSLRAAQQVPDFLERRAHPVRRLIVAIGSASLGLDETAGDEDATVAAVANVVHELLVDFDESLEPFEAATTRLTDFVAERTRREDGDARALVQAIAQRELAEVPFHIARDEVARRLRSRLWVPQPVRAMLSESWVRALAAAYANGAEEGAEWQKLVRTMDDLLWSVEPKASPEGRRRLAATLPSLVSALLEGLQRAEASDAQRDQFLSHLVDCHANAMKSGMRGMTLVPDTTNAQTPAIARTTFSVGERRVEQLRLAAGSEAVADTALEAVTRLRLGAWVQLERGARAAAHKRLAWASPVTGACLFVGISPTSTGVCIDIAALAELLRRGEARIVDDTPLFERALGAMLQKAGTPQG